MARHDQGIRVTEQCRFHGGTLVLERLDKTASVPSCFLWVKGKWRCPALHYHEIQPWLQEQGIVDTVPRWKRLKLVSADGRQPHDYQQEALRAWLKAGGRGSIVLPTGAGKTFVALQAIVHLGRSSLVVAPTIDLLHQWYTRLTDGLQEEADQNLEVGVWYGLEKELRPITVTTYHSAGDLVAEVGHTFKLLVFDEVHHLPAPSWQEIALMSPAPHRLGLTATYPETNPNGQIPMSQQPTPGWDLVTEHWPLEDLIGPVVYVKNIDELTGKQLAEYRTQRIRVDLTPQERATYDAEHAVYAAYYREHKLRESYGPAWWGEYTRRSAYDAEARRAKVAERRLKRIVANAQGKLEKLESLLKEHAHQQVLVFTAHNDLAYRISRRHLIPSITHQTKAVERKAILTGFRDGLYRAIVTSRVLNEGVDVPEAKVAVVLGGTASAREYIQRLGRILRKQENKTALLYEIVVRGTIEEGISYRRGRKVEYRIEKKDADR
jgi:superfamily II DNA or RNA helicase